MEDCWYKRNHDRLNEYCEEESVHYVANSETAEHIRWEGIDIEGGDPPIFFQLCDICSNPCPFIIYGQCKKCGASMIDQGLNLKGDKYCRMCYDMDEIVRIISLYVPKMNQKIDWDKIDWNILNEASPNNYVIKALILAMEIEATVEHQKSQEKRKKRKARNTEVENAIGWVAPGISKKTCIRIRKTFHVRHVPTDLEEFLIFLVDRKEECDSDI